MIGFIRTISDGVYVVVIQDLLVLPDYQRQGIGKQLLDCVLQQTKSFKQVFLLTDNSEYNKGVKQFYYAQGLKEFSQCQITGFMA